MKLGEYQECSKRTMSIKGWNEAISNYSMGLAGESGEVVDLLKKVIHHEHPLTKEVKDKLYFELGDVLHYVAGLATLLDLDLDMIALSNVLKLKKRYPNGFTPIDSINRVDQERK